MQNELNELRNQVRTLRRMLFGVFGLVVVGGLLAAQGATVNTEQDKPMKVQLVGPIKIGPIKVDDCIYVQSGTNRNNLRPFKIQGK
jgi:hypothetical protein